MGKIKLTKKLAMWYHNKTILDEESKIEYRFTANTFKRNGQKVLNSLSVDAFNQDNDWEEELSETFFENELMETEYYPWLVPIQ